MPTKPIMLAITFAVTGWLTACAAGYYVAEAANILVDDMSSESRYEFEAPNHYDPIVSFANESFIRIKYLDNDENAQPDEAMMLISKHCDGSFTETSRRTSHGVTYVEAECT